MSAIDRAFIRAYEPETNEHLSDAPALANSGDPVAPSSAAATHIDWSELDAHSQSFYVFAHGSHASPPQQPSTAPVNGATSQEAPASEEPPAVATTAVPAPHASTAAVVRTHPAVATADSDESEVDLPTEPSSENQQKRPLSDFLQTSAVEATFRPAYEVDAYSWPDLCRQLSKSGAVWQSAIDSLHTARDAGRTLIGVAGAGADSGCTSTLVCLAMSLAREGMKVAMVDGNFHEPALARRLGIDTEIGWEDVLAGRVPLAEAAIRSLSDDAVLLPLINGGTPAAEKLDGVHASVTAGVLRYHYDFVLFDLGAVAIASQNAVARRIVRNCRLDGVVLALRELDADWASRDQLEQTSPELAEICLGVVQRNALSQ